MELVAESVNPKQGSGLTGVNRGNMQLNIWHGGNAPPLVGQANVEFTRGLSTPPAPRGSVGPSCECHQGDLQWRPVLQVGPTCVFPQALASSLAGEIRRHAGVGGAKALGAATRGRPRGSVGLSCSSPELARQ